MRVSAADPLTNKCQHIALEQTAEWTGGCDVLSIDGIFVEQSAHWGEYSALEFQRFSIWVVDPGC